MGRVAESLSESFFAAFAVVLGLMARLGYRRVTIIDTADQPV